MRRQNEWLEFSVHGRKKRCSLPFSVYRRENDRSVPIFDVRNGQVYERRGKDVAERAPAKNGRIKSNF